MKQNKQEPGTLVPTLDELYTLASSISKKDPHYKEAQDYCANILTTKTKIPSPETKNEDLESEELEYRQSLKTRLTHIWNGAHDIPTLNVFFQALCGEGIDKSEEAVELDITKFSLDNLLQIADLFYIKNQRISKAEELIDAQKKIIKDLKRTTGQEEKTPPTLSSSKDTVWLNLRKIVQAKCPPRSQLSNE